MSLLSASVRAPVAPVLRHSEASSSCASSVEGVSSRAVPRASFLRRNFQDSLKKTSVQSTCYSFDRVSRGLLTPGGWSPSLKCAIVGVCFWVVLITLLARNSLCPVSMLLHRLQVSARQAEHSVRSVPVQVAHELINAGHRCLDVRTQEEYVAGHVEGAVNIPYLLKCGPGMTKNHRFLEDVEAEFGKDDEIIVSCQSGRRSLMAAGELRAANFTGITDMGGGYLAWKESGLPTVHARRTPSPST